MSHQVANSTLTWFSVATSSKPILRTIMQRSLECMQLATAMRMPSSQYLHLLFYDCTPPMGFPYSLLKGLFNSNPALSGHTSPGIGQTLLNIHTRHLNPPAPSSRNFFQRQEKVIKVSACETLSRPNQTNTTPVIAIKANN